MLKIVAVLLLVGTNALGQISNLGVGTVVRRISGCDYFIVQTKSDYAVLEWFGGHDPDKDEVIIGNINSYGFKTFLYQNDEDQTSRLYVEDYGLSKTDALEKLIDHCG